MVPYQVYALGYVSEASLDAALPDAKSAPAVNSQGLFAKERSAADGRAPSEGQAQNSKEHIPK